VKLVWYGVGDSKLISRGILEYKIAKTTDPLLKSPLGDYIAWAGLEKQVRFENFKQAVQWCQNYEDSL